MENEEKVGKGAILIRAERGSIDQGKSKKAGVSSLSKTGYVPGFRQPGRSEPQIVVLDFWPYPTPTTLVKAPH